MAMNKNLDGPERSFRKRVQDRLASLFKRPVKQENVVVPDMTEEEKKKARALDLKQRRERYMKKRGLRTFTDPKTGRTSLRLLIRLSEGFTPGWRGKATEDRSSARRLRQMERGANVGQHNGDGLYNGWRPGEILDAGVLGRVVTTRKEMRK